MSEIFLKIINMSISASYIVLAVLLLRLLLKKAPKWITVVLWGIVAVRLICKGLALSPGLGVNDSLRTGFKVLLIIGIPVLMVGVLSVIIVGLTTSELGIKLSTLSMEKGQIRRTATIPQRTTVIHLGAFFKSKRKRSTASTI